MVTVRDFRELNLQDASVLAAYARAVGCLKGGKVAFHVIPREIC